MEEKEYAARRESIRAYCIWCCGDSKPEVRKCTSKKCPLWRFRMGVEDIYAYGIRLTRGQAIKERCIDCCAGDRKAVKNCTFTNCALHKYRP